jgi:DNA-binding transcriptional LysR family regulator
MVGDVLDLRLLETFREVAARGSFSAAAEALSFTQPAVSQHVARLEKQVGTRLFDRDARGVTPTRAGHAMLRHAEALLEAARRAEADVRAEAGLHVPEVRIAAFASAAAGLVPMALRELRSLRPDIRPRLRVIEEEPALDELLLGRVDVALITGSELAPAPSRPGVDTELVLEDPMLVALPRSHPLASHPAIDLDELREEEWMLTAVGGTCQDSNIVRHACAAAGFAPRVHFESEDYPALLGLTASGMGVTVIPSLASLTVPTDVIVRPIAGDPPKRLVYAARRADADDPAADAALDALRIAGRRLALGLVPTLAAA